MAEVRTISLGVGFSCAVGGDAWYLVERGPGDLFLEGRFEDDRGALGRPSWVSTRFCTEQTEWGAVCVLPLHMPLAAKPPEEYSFVPEQVWAAARVETEKLLNERGGA
jgi:hypothetical protein